MLEIGFESRQQEYPSRLDTDGSGAEGEEKAGLLDSQRQVNVSAPQRSFRLSLAFYAFSTFVILVQAFIILYCRAKLFERPPKLTHLGLRAARDHTRLSGVLNRFWQGDSLEGPNAAWDAINSGHGIIKVDASFAQSHHFPHTLHHPHDHGKLAYALEAYHMIHCIQVLRRDYLLIRDNAVPSQPLEHAMHCFDALRQSVMCQASSELLPITGNGHQNGFNQTRQCRDWDALRDFATQHTACYWDDEVPEGETRDMWEICDDGTDGLPVGNLLD